MSANVIERIAVVGAGYFAQFHLQGWADLGLTPVAICDVDLERAKALGQRFDVPSVYADLTEMLKREDLQLIDIVLPPQAQRPVVTEVIEAGLPAICQKPFGQDLREAEQLCALASAHGTALVVHENFRFTPWFRECRRFIDAGRLGRVHSISFRLRPGDGQGPQAYLDRQPYFQQMPKLLVRETAVHYIDSFRYLMGEVIAVSARLRKLNPVIRGEDAGIIMFEFADERSGLFDGNRLNDHVADDPRTTMGEMWLEGSLGVLRLDGLARLWWKPHQQGECEHPYERGHGAFGGAVTALQRHVIEHLQAGTALENDAASYMRNLVVQEAVYASHATGRRIELSNFNPNAGY
jgi:D-apiose dehydrogenase